VPRHYYDEFVAFAKDHPWMDAEVAIGEFVCEQCRSEAEVTEAVEACIEAARSLGMQLTDCS